MNSNKLKRLLINTQVLKSDLLDLKKYSYFLKKIIIILVPITIK